jgi:DNA-binding NtrC family response regulator
LITEGPVIKTNILPADIIHPEEKASASVTDKEPARDALKNHMEETEKQIIAAALDECGGNVTRAAQKLGLSRKGLQLKMIKHNLRKREE